MQDRLRSAALGDRDALFDGRRLEVRPLLQLDNDRGRSTVVSVAGNHRIEPAGGERQLLLEQDAVIGEPTERRRFRERAQRVASGPLLARGGLEAAESQERVPQLKRDSVLHRAADEVLRRLSGGDGFASGSDGRFRQAALLRLVRTPGIGGDDARLSVQRYGAPIELRQDSAVVSALADELLGGRESEVASAPE